MQNANNLRFETVMIRADPASLIGSGRFIGQIFAAKGFRGPIPVASNPTPPQDDGVVRVVG
jgi:hypothetical protein